MENPTNKTLDEVKEPGTRGKLEGFQEVSFDVDTEIKNVKRDIEARKVTAQVANLLGARIFGEAQFIQGQVDKSAMLPDEAKIRMDQTRKITDMVRTFEGEMKAEAIKLSGKLSGLEQTSQLLSKRFTDTSLKYERHQRMEAEDAENDPRAPLDSLIPPVTLFQGKVKLGGKTKKGKK